MNTLFQDIRYGLRMLLKNPGFTAVAIFSLALGIGANTAVFSVVNAVLLKSLPYRNPESIVLVWGEDKAAGNSRGQVSATDVADWRTRNHVFEEITAFGSVRPSLSGIGPDMNASESDIKERRFPNRRVFWPSFNGRFGKRPSLFWRPLQ